MLENDQSQLKNTLLPYDKEIQLRKIFFFACFTTILINLDHGIMPASTKEIRHDLNIDEFDLGLLGSLVYGGLMLGSLTGGYIFQNFSSKKVICATTFLYGAFLIIFPLTTSTFWLGFSRVFVGFFQVFMVIYFPVWVDLYGKEKRTIWLTYLQLMVPLGVVLGYCITALFVHIETWRWSFYLQIVLLIPCFAFFCTCKSQNMAANNPTSGNKSTAFDNRDDHLLRMRSGSFLQNYSKPSELESYLNSQALSDCESEEEDIRPPGKSAIVYYFFVLWKRKIYIFTMLTIAALYFVVTGVQFWISDYLRIVLNLPKETVFFSFSFVSVTAPTIGVLCGGYIVDKYGGYTSKNALNICIVFGIMAAVFGVPIPFFDGFWAVFIFLWLVLFFGGAIMPPITGIMISSVPRNLRALGQSTAQIFQNLLGYFPAPFLYGYVNRLTGGENSRGGMIMMFSWSLWGVVGLALAKFYQIRRRRKRRLARNANTTNAFLELIDIRNQFKSNLAKNALKNPETPKKLVRFAQTYAPKPIHDDLTNHNTYPRRSSIDVSSNKSKGKDGVTNFNQDNPLMMVLVGYSYKYDITCTSGLIFYLS